MRKLNKAEADKKLHGSHKVAKLYGYNFLQLLYTLGIPTYYPEDSGDGKVQYEWVFEYEDKYFTIYDWKTFNKEYTEKQCVEWSIGGKSDATNFINVLEGMLPPRLNTNNN
jgi:hypothetical protein